MSLTEWIGEYQLLRCLGSGSAGRVYAARFENALGFEKRAALKVLHPHYASDDAMRRDIINEAKVGALLRHPNIVETREFFEHDGLLTIVMDYIDGPNLRQLLEPQLPLGGRACLQILLQLLQAIHYAHRLRVSGALTPLIHRDIKPSNILFTPDTRLKLVDFGLAKVSGFTDKTDGGIRGTPRYFSPEQASGLPLSPKSDLFSVGLIAYEILHGEPFCQESHFFRALLWWQNLTQNQITERLGALCEDAEYFRPVLDSLLKLEPNQRAEARQAIFDLSRIPSSELGGEELSTLLGLIKNDVPPILQKKLPAESVLEPKQSPFFGREDHFSLLESNHQQAVITVRGVGGIGKSRFVHEAMKRDQWENVCWFDLHEVNSADALCSVIAEKMQLAFSYQDLSEFSEKLSATLPLFKETIFVLDGFTGVLEDLKIAITQWSQHGHWICTGRQALGLSGERVIELPLLTPDETSGLLETICPQQLSAEELRLLQQRTEGLPLAIELVATQLQSRTVGELLDAELLAFTSPLLPRHQRSLMETISRSWAMLDAIEQRTLAQLSVFPRSFCVDAAEAVLDYREWNAAAPKPELLSSLLAQSLLQRVRSRLQLLSAIRNFARLQLSDAQRGRAELSMAQWYAQWGLSLHHRFGSQSRHEELNFKRSIEVCLQRNERVLALRNTLALVQARRRWQGTAQQRRVYDAVRFLLQDDCIPSAHIRFRYSEHLRLSGDYQQSHSLLMRLVPFFEQRKLEADLIMVLNSVALTRLDQGNTESALSSLDRAYEVASQMGSEHLMGTTLSNRGYCLTQSSMFEQALATLQQALQHLEHGGDELAQHQVLSNMGLIALRRGDALAAITLYSRAFELCGHQMSQGFGLAQMNLGLAHVLQNQVDAADQCFLRANSELKRIGAHRNLAILHANWALLRVTQGRWASADRHCVLAEKSNQEHYHPVTAYLLRRVQCFLALNQSLTEAALQLSGQALSLVEEYGFEFYLLEAQCLQIEVLTLSNKFQGAKNTLESLRLQVETIKGVSTNSSIGDLQCDFISTLAEAWGAIATENKSLANTHAKNCDRMITEGRICRPDYVFLLKRCLAAIEIGVKSRS